MIRPTKKKLSTNKAPRPRKRAAAGAGAAARRVSIARKPRVVDAAQETEGRREQFVYEYVIDYNGTRAYKAIYGENLSDNVAAAAASRLLRDVKVKASLEALESGLLEDLGLRAYRILRESARIGFSDPLNVYDDKGGIKPMAEIDAPTRAAIASVEVTEEYAGKGEERKVIGLTKKLKFWNKNEAVSNLMKHKGLFKLDNEQIPVPTVNVGRLTVTMDFKKVKAGARKNSSGA